MYKLVDKKILFSDKFNFCDLECIGFGANAKVYKIELEGKYYALKIFNEPKYWDLKKMKKKLDLNISSFVFPVRISYLNNKFNGYVMDFYNGCNLQKQELNISINEFIEYANKLFNDTDKLSELRYIIQDESISNTMFNDGFKIIDIDFYDNEFNPLLKDVDDIKRFNRKAITRLLVNIFILKARIADLFEKNIELEQLRINCILGKLSLEKFINIVCNMIFNIEKIDVSSLTLSKIKK